MQDPEEQPGRREPLQNEDAENAIVAACMISDATLGVVIDLVEPEDFYSAGPRAIFAAMRTLHLAERRFDATVLAETLKGANELRLCGGYEGLTAILSTPFISSALPELAAIVRGLAVRRRMREAGHAITDIASETGGSIEEAIEAAQARLFAIAKEQRDAAFSPMRDLVREAAAAVEQAQSRDDGHRLSGQPVGLVPLDKVMGGLGRGELILVAARPSIGKTALALNWARSIIKHAHRPVGFFSLEMGAVDLVHRLLAMDSGTSAYKLLNLRADEFERSRYARTAQAWANAGFFVNDSGGMTLNKVRAGARRLLAQQPNTAAIFIDYVQLMGSPRGERRSNRQEEVAAISMGLKSLAKELGVAVVALSQLSRSLEYRQKDDANAEPCLSDLRESGQLEQDADKVLFIHRKRLETMRDDSGNPMHDVRTGVPTTLILAKHRNGPLGRVACDFFPNSNLFLEPVAQTPPPTREQERKDLFD